MKSILSLTIGVVCSVTVMSIRSEQEKLDYEVSLSEARMDAQDARQIADQLLSDGRFMRQYDAKFGRSIYKFKPAHKDVPQAAARVAQGKPQITVGMLADLVGVK